jgi:hypothetical protein
VKLYGGFHLGKCFFIGVPLRRLFAELRHSNPSPGAQTQKSGCSSGEAGCTGCNGPRKLTATGTSTPKRELYNRVAMNTANQGRWFCQIRRIQSTPWNATQYYN